MAETSLDTSPVDLTNCDIEPIHIPGSIQPHGALLALDVSMTQVLRHSANAAALLGLEGEINGSPIGQLVGERLAHDLRNALGTMGDTARPALLFGQSGPNGGRFDIAVHRYRSTVIVEFEAVEAGSEPPLQLSRTMVDRIARLDTVDSLVKVTARLVRSVLGYDRVMIYEFQADGSGKVVAEARRGDLESFLGQYFPFSDIPRQARALYLKNTIRIISSASYEPVRLNPQYDLSGEPLDLSYAHLRSVSPIHLEYLVRSALALTGECVLEWTETGGPRVTPPAREGFGTTLLNRSIRFDLGGESDLQYRPEGLKARFVLPARNVRRKFEAKAESQQLSGRRSADHPDLPRDLRIMLLEDQILIAMDVESTLADRGFTSVSTVNSVAEALKLVNRAPPAIAILDISLGDGTSLPVAEELALRRIPFIFATGYGDGGIIPDRFADVPVIRKPYEAEALLAAPNRIGRS